MAQTDERMKPFPAWSSFMGCTKSCADWLGIDHSPDWIWGVSGYAFLLNMHPTLCPSSPTAFDNSFLKNNAEALGLGFQAIIFTKGDPNFAEKQKEALEYTRQALERKQPVFGLELNIPEYYLITGTDETGYRYIDMDGQTKTCPWEKLGTSDIGLVEINMIAKAEQNLSVADQVRSALKFLAAYQADPASYALPGYTMGLGAYDVWIGALRKDAPDPFGLTYNARVWGEARSGALGFLQEIKSKLGARDDYALLDSAILHFSSVEQAFREINGLFHSFPPNPEEHTKENFQRAAELLTQARDAEQAGIKALLDWGEGL